MLLTGDGIGPDAPAAFACFLCAAESGDAGGHAMLVHCLENGSGTEKNWRPPLIIIAAPQPCDMRER